MGPVYAPPSAASLLMHQVSFWIKQKYKLHKKYAYSCEEIIYIYNHLYA